MFRIPDYVAGTRPDGVSPQSAADAPAAAHKAALPRRPPTAEERRLTAHMARRQAEAARFAAESRFLDAQAEADAAEEAARAEAGPAGTGLTGIVARNLSLLKETLLAGLPPEAPDDLRTAIAERFAAEAERRLDRAAKEEVRTGHEATRAKLGQMHADLLDRIAREPDRFEELAAQGEGFTAVNTLPAAERAERLADWRARVAQVRGGAASGPATDGARPQDGGAQLPSNVGRAITVDRYHGHFGTADMASQPASRGTSASRPGLGYATATQPPEQDPVKAGAVPADTGERRSDDGGPLPERQDVVAAVLHAPVVVEAWDDYEEDPTPANLRRVSEALVEAQADAGVPTAERTPISPREERDHADAVLQNDGQARLVAIRRLAAGLQERHGDAADLALRAVARHWADDARANAFAEFLAGEMDSARIVAPGGLPTTSAANDRAAEVDAQHDDAAIDAVWNRPAAKPPSEAMLAYAEHAAEKQRTSPQVRDRNGNFLRGEPLGEVVQLATGDGFQDSNGEYHLADQSRHVVLLDPFSGRWLVFERILAHDTYRRGVILPFRRNERTGKREFALPHLLHDPLEAAKLPHDVYSGRVDPRSQEGLERAVDAAGLFTGGPIISRARPDSVAIGIRRPPKGRTHGDYDVVEIKTTPTRSSNAVRGTPEHQALNNPKPSTIYKLDNGETFRTNAYGKVELFEYKPSRFKRGRGKLQTQVGKLGLEDDVGGHIRGSRHGGSIDLYNLFQQNKNFNNGAFKRFENELDRNLDKIEYVRIEFIRKNPASDRPDYLKTEYSMGGKIFRRTFKNAPGGK